MNAHKYRCIALLPAFLLLLFLAACGNGNGEAEAAAMRLKRAEGTVTVSDDAGADVPLLEDLGLYSGYEVGTRPESYAWIDLDNVKLAKMDQASEIAIQKQGGDLEIEVLSGSLFFRASEPPEEGESMVICASAMSVGVRGACGWAALSEDGEQLSVYLLEGKVRCEADGERETVRAGEMAVMSEDGEIAAAEFTARDVPAFVLEEIQADEALCGAILDQIGLDLLGTGEDNALAAALERIAYYGDPAQCAMTPEQAAAFAQVIRDNMARLDAEAAAAVANGGGELIFNGISWGTLVDHPSTATAALFDLGGGAPALLFGGALLDRSDNGACSWLNPGIRGIWLYQDGSAVQYAPDKDKQAVFDGYLLTGGWYEDDKNYSYKVYPLAEGAIAGQPSATAVMEAVIRPGTYVNTVPEPEYHYYIDGAETSKEAFGAWVGQWANAEYDPDRPDLPWGRPQSPAGISHGTDISWTSWGMGPAEELLAVLEELAGGPEEALTAEQPVSPGLPADGDRTVFRGTVGLYSYQDLVDLYGDDPNPGSSGNTLLILPDEPVTVPVYSAGSETAPRNTEVTAFKYGGDAQSLEQYVGQHLILSIGHVTATSDTSIPLDAPWAGDVRVLEAGPAVS